MKTESGQTMVEFTLVLPILALLIFGIIQFGLVFNNYLTLTDAVRAGARKAVVSRTVAVPGDVARQAVLDASTDLDTNQVQVDVQAADNWQPGTDVQVTASYPYSINLLGLVVMSGRIHSTTTERLE